MERPNSTRRSDSLREPDTCNGMTAAAHHSSPIAVRRHDPGSPIAPAALATSSTLDFMALDGNSTSARVPGDPAEPGPWLLHSDLTRRCWNSGIQIHPIAPTPAGQASGFRLDLEP